MKKLLFILLSIIVMVPMMAQSKISSVYGVNLGDSESTVTSRISGTWKTTSKGVRYYNVSNPTLGNCTFKVANFFFKEGKLNNVVFSSAEGGAINPDFQNPYGGSNGYEQFLSNSQRFQRIYRNMYSNLADKYGSPTLEDEEEAVWKSNGNMIKLEYSFEDTLNEWGMRECSTSVSVSYSVQGSSSSNF